MNWVFNSWGEKNKTWELDNGIATAVLQHAGLKRIDNPFILEGGSIHVDGEGCTRIPPSSPRTSALPTVVTTGSLFGMSISQPIILGFTAEVKVHMQLSTIRTSLGLSMLCQAFNAVYGLIQLASTRACHHEAY